jgi:integrase
LGLSPQDCAEVLDRTAAIAAKPEYKSESIPSEWLIKEGKLGQETRRHVSAKAKRQAERWERRREELAEVKRKAEEKRLRKLIAELAEAERKEEKQRRPKTRNVVMIIHHPAMPYTEVPKFMMELSHKNDLLSLALRLLIMTAKRTSEVLKAEWSEIYLENGVCVIPAERMKTKREHRVTLTKAMIVDLMALPLIEDNLYL